MPHVIREFFSAWDDMETMHPFGVQRFTPLFREFGVPSQLCIPVDRLLYLDMMVPVYSNIRRIKMEDRRSSRILWVYVELMHFCAFVGFQTSPSDPFEYLTVINALPHELIALMISYFFGTRNTTECNRVARLGCGRRQRVE